MADRDHDRRSDPDGPSTTNSRQGWWQASDGEWYPPEARPGGGWWQAPDGRWYPPNVDRHGVSSADKPTSIPHAERASRAALEPEVALGPEQHGEPASSRPAPQTGDEMAWWRAPDGKWYPLDVRQSLPRVSLEEKRYPPDSPPGWWRASDGRWYPPPGPQARLRWLQLFGVFAGLAGFTTCTSLFQAQNGDPGLVAGMIYGLAIAAGIAIAALLLGVRACLVVRDDASPDGDSSRIPDSLLIGVGAVALLVLVLVTFVITAISNGTWSGIEIDTALLSWCFALAALGGVALGVLLPAKAATDDPDVGAPGVRPSPDADAPSGLSGPTSSHRGADASAPPLASLPEPPRRDTHRQGLGVLSLVLGLISLPLIPFGIFGVAAVICGLLALRRPAPGSTPSDLAVAGAVLGAVSLAGLIPFWLMSSDSARQYDADTILHLGVGQCLNGDLEELPVTVVSCRAVHDGEVYAVLEHDAGPGVGYPGSDALMSYGHERCDQAFAEYVGISYEESELDLITHWPTEDAWNAGIRRMVCVAGYLDGSSLDRSIRGSRS